MGFQNVISEGENKNDDAEWEFRGDDWEIPRGGEFRDDNTRISPQLKSKVIMQGKPKGEEFWPRSLETIHSSPL